MEAGVEGTILEMDKLLIERIEDKGGVKDGDKVGHIALNVCFQDSFQAFLWGDVNEGVWRS